MGYPQPISSTSTTLYHRLRCRIRDRRILVLSSKDKFVGDSISVDFDTRTVHAILVWRNTHNVLETGIFLFNHCSLVHFAVDVPSKIFFYTAIITPNYDGLESPMLLTKFRGNRPAGFGEEDFKGFYHIGPWRQSWSGDQHHVIKFSFPCT